MKWPLIKLLPPVTNFRFVAFARYAAIASILVTVGSLVLCFTQGLNLGIDFRGGTVVELVTPRPVDLAQVRSVTSGLNLGDVQVQTFATRDDPTGARHASVRFQTPPTANPAQTVTRVKDALTGALGQVAYTRTEVVGPKVSGELFQSGIMALGVAILLMLIYIWFRFQLQFGLGAVVALFHDVILVFGVFALTRMEFTLTGIAAILTVIGYSMNDTVVVFDRLRENLRKYKRMPLREVIDLSINETLSRTVITGLTAILALGGLAIFGGEALFPFSIALLVGIMIGTYSSIYVAAPVVLLWGVKRGEKDPDATPIAPQGASPNAVRTVPRP